MVLSTGKGERTGRKRGETELCSVCISLHMCSCQCLLIISMASLHHKESKLSRYFIFIFHLLCFVHYQVC
jgi:hypothetical protein